MGAGIACKCSFAPEVPRGRVEELRFEQFINFSKKLFLGGITNEDSYGSFGRQFSHFASNAVGQRRSSARALLTLSLGCSVRFQLSFPLTNHNLFTIGFSGTKVVNFPRPYFRRANWLLRSSNRFPLLRLAQITLFSRRLPSPAS